MIMQFIIEIPDERQAADFVADMLEQQDRWPLLTPMYETRVNARLVNGDEHAKKMIAAFRAIDFNEPSKPYTGKDVQNILLNALR